MINKLTFCAKQFKVLNGKVAINKDWLFFRN